MGITAGRSYPILAPSSLSFSLLEDTTRLSRRPHELPVGYVTLSSSGLLSEVDGGFSTALGVCAVTVLQHQMAGYSSRTMK